MFNMHIQYKKYAGRHCKDVLIKDGNFFDEFTVFKNDFLDWLKDKIDDPDEYTRNVCHLGAIAMLCKIK